MKKTNRWKIPQIFYHTIKLEIWNMLKNNLTVINLVINQPLVFKYSFVYILSRKYILHLQYECCKTMQMAFFVNVYKIY